MRRSSRANAWSSSKCWPRSSGRRRRRLDGDMRAIFCATCVALTLSGGQQRPSDVYDSAIAKYVAGDSETAFETLGRVSQEDIRYNLELYLIAVRRNGLSEGV